MHNGQVKRLTDVCKSKYAILSSRLSFIRKELNSLADLEAVFVYSCNFKVSYFNWGIVNGGLESGGGKDMGREMEGGREEGGRER